MERRLGVRRLLVILALAMVVASVSMANPVCVPDGTLQSYINTYTSLATACQIGDKLFYGFSFVPGGGTSATGVQVNAPAGLDGITEVGISFNTGGWAVVAGNVIDAFLGYTVTTLSGQPLIEDATLTIVGTLTGSGGSGTVIETLTPAVAGSPITDSLPVNTSNHIDFSTTTVTTLQVMNEIHLVGGAGFAGLSHISVVENDFSENVSLPEPLSMVLIGSGLLLFGAARRKQFRRG